MWVGLPLWDKSSPAWSSTRVEMLMSPYPCDHLKSIWRSKGVGILLSSQPCEHSKSTWSSMWVGISMSSWDISKSTCGNDDVFLPLWDKSSQLEDFLGWAIWCLLTLVNIPSQLEVHGCGNFDSFLPLWALEVNLKFRGGDRSCASRVAQSWELRNLPNVVAQAELRNPGSCASWVAQSKLCNPEKFRNLTLSAKMSADVFRNRRCCDV